MSTALKPARISFQNVNPEVVRTLVAFSKTGVSEGLPERTVAMVHLRASQINGCSVCTEMHAAELKQAGGTDEQVVSVAAWRDAPYFSDAERAALALAEAGTRLSDRSEPVPDEIWDEAARHYDEAALSALVVQIAGINAWNRLNVITRQPSGRRW